MPTKPIVFLALPTYGCKQNWKSMGVMKDKKKGGFEHWLKPDGEEVCTGDHAILPTETIYKVAKKAGIPTERVLNSYDILRKRPKNAEPVFTDVTHPSSRGHDLLGKEAYKIMSQDKEL
jgi:hypothetical protein